MDANETYSAISNIEAQKNTTDKGDVRLSERDYPIDADVEATVKGAYSSNTGTMNVLSEITTEQNKAINRLVNQTNNDAYRGKYEGGKHKFSDTAIRHIIKEHGDFLREGLRAQLPMSLTDIARHLSAVKENKKPRDVKPTKTKEGYPSILTSYEVNGYTLYAEEITKPLGKNLPNDLIGHTMYKAPTLPTAAFYTTSVQTQPKRQSEVLCEYYMPNSTDLSMGNFVVDKNGNPAQLYFVSKNGSAKQDARTSGLIALSSSSINFTDKAGQVGQGYVVCKKPFYITHNNRVFSNSETNVAEKINELKRQGYDCFIFDKVVGDNYMVAVVNKAQIIKDTPKVITNNGQVVFSNRDPEDVSNRSLLANALSSTAKNADEKQRLLEYKSNIRMLDAEQDKLQNLNKQIKELSFSKGARDAKKLDELKKQAKATANRINYYDKKLLELESVKAIKDVLSREKKKAVDRQKQKDAEYLKQYKERVANEQKEIVARYQESRKKAVEGRQKTVLLLLIKKTGLFTTKKKSQRKACLKYNTRGISTLTLLNLVYAILMKKSRKTM